MELGTKLTPSRVLVLGFAGIILMGAALLTLSIASQDGHQLRFLDALFTATSAVCVTGLVVVDTGTHFTQFGQFIIIALIQIGGLGIMTLSTLLAIILGKKIGLKERILIQESFNQFNLAGLVRLIRNVILMTLAFEVTGGILLTLRFMQQFPFDRAVAFGFFHSVSSFCNAGFDLFGQVYGPYTSITHYASDWLVSPVIGALIVFGGLGFPTIMELVRYPRARKLSLHTKVVVKVTTFLILVGAILILVIELNNPKTIGGLDISGKLLSAIFQSITPRTAGYNSLSMDQLRPATWFLMVILMFIGASPSSTGGGVKTTTMSVMLATIIATIKGKDDVEMFERRIPRDLVYKALTLITIALGWVSVVTLVMSFVEPYEFLRLFFEVMSGFGTVGLTTGITPHLTDLSRVLLIITMFIGRVGILTVAVALSKTYKPTASKFIEDKIVIG
ncbi:MAG TPA: TrkH family potassium uptake protein [Bacillota bacterium]|nr:TrkH family potassium uptake protein [Bacillota bacterium]